MNLPEPGSRHSSTIHVTPEVVRAFSSVSGDVNPLHDDLAAARRLVFGRRVAHGGILLADLAYAVVDPRIRRG